MNFAILGAKIEAAAKKAFEEMFQKHGAEGLYSFALYSDEGAMTVCPAANTLKHLATADPSELGYHKFEPAEWKYEMQGADAEFNEICDALREELFKEENDDDAWFEQFQKQLFETCIACLEKLKGENFFRDIAGRDIFLTFSVSDYDFEDEELIRIAERLNDNAYKTEYLNWLGTGDLGA